ncbi:uncharacterized protein WCC33_006401 [Rhinophrynus dorsalis]
MEVAMLFIPVNDQQIHEARGQTGVKPSCYADQKQNIHIGLGAAGGIIGLAAIILLALCCIRSKGKKMKTRNRPPDSGYQPNNDECTPYAITERKDIEGDPSTIYTVVNKLKTQPEEDYFLVSIPKTQPQREYALMNKQKTQPEAYYTLASEPKIQPEADYSLATEPKTQPEADYFLATEPKAQHEAVYSEVEIKPVDDDLCMAYSVVDIKPK